jgi:membrane fusion protein (multidrug efflux system)
VLELVALDRLRLDVQVPQEHTAAIDADTPVDLVLDADPGRRHPARVVAKVPVQDPTARSFLVRIEPEEPLPLMMPGMSGRAIFSLRREEALLLPRDAIVMEPDGTRIVWVVEEQDGIGTVSRRPVEIVNSLEESVELRSGVSAGTRVVLHGNETLREGQSVRVLADR